MGRDDPGIEIEWIPRWIEVVQSPMRLRIMMGKMTSSGLLMVYGGAAELKTSAVLKDAVPALALRLDDEAASSFEDTTIRAGRLAGENESSLKNPFVQDRSTLLHCQVTGHRTTSGWKLMCVTNARTFEHQLMSARIDPILSWLGKLGDVKVQVRDVKRLS